MREGRIRHHRILCLQFVYAEDQIKSSMQEYVCYYSNEWTLLVGLEYHKEVEYHSQVSAEAETPLKRRVSQRRSIHCGTGSARIKLVKEIRDHLPIWNTPKQLTAYLKDTKKLTINKIPCLGRLIPVIINTVLVMLLSNPITYRVQCCCVVDLWF